MLRKLGYAAVLIGALAAPFFLYPVLLMKIMCFALFACAFNLLIGFTGLLSFGHAAFFGGSAYIAGHALKVWGVPTEIGLVLGVLYAAIMGFVIGKLAIRRQGIYFTMITMALSQMVFFVFLQAPFTGGEDGLQSIPRGWYASFIHRSDRCSRPCAKMSRARSRWVTTPIVTSCWRSCCRLRWPGWRVRPKRLCWALAH